MAKNKVNFSQEKEWLLKAFDLDRRIRVGKASGWEVMRFARDYHIAKLNRLTQEGSSTLSSGEG